MKVFLPITLTILGVAFWGLVSHTNNSSYTYSKPLNNKHHAIIKIKGVGEKGSCTAFVISKYAALTAAHCVTSRGILGIPLLNTKGFNVYNSHGEDTKIIAFLSKEQMGPRMDYAVIKGDFSKFNQLPVMIKKMYHTKNELVTHCGYAAGNYPPICTKGTLVKKDYFQMQTTADLIPGMSGGPVINKDGVVIGINSAVKEDVALYCPTFGILQLEIKK